MSNRRSFKPLLTAILALAVTTCRYRVDKIFQPDSKKESPFQGHA